MEGSSRRQRGCSRGQDARGDAEGRSRAGVQAAEVRPGAGVPSSAVQRTKGAQRGTSAADAVSATSSTGTRAEGCAEGALGRLPGATKRSAARRNGSRVVQRVPWSCAARSGPRFSTAHENRSGPGSALARPGAGGLGVRVVPTSCCSVDLAPRGGGLRRRTLQAGRRSRRKRASVLWKLESVREKP